jgi:hypothetical protein
VNAYLWKIKIDLEVHDRELDYWINHLIIQTPSQVNVLKEKCEICEAEEDLELHHIGGRKHMRNTITVCQNCHRILSDLQKLWDKRWELTDQSESVRDAFLLQGLYDILKLKSRYSKTSYEDLADKLVEEISKRLKI